MKGKLALLVGAGVGYVLGTRDGRRRYEQMKTKAESVWKDPRVREKVSDAKDTATHKLSEAKGSATSRLSGGSASDASGVPTDTTSTTTPTTPPPPTVGPDL